MRRGNAFRVLREEAGRHSSVLSDAVQPVTGCCRRGQEWPREAAGLLLDFEMLLLLTTRVQ